MSNLKISQLPNYSGSTSGSWLIANNSGETQTFKIQRETFLNGYTPSSDLTALSSSIAVTDLNQNNAISALASSGSLTALSSSIALTDLNQNNEIAGLATTSSLTSVSSSIASTDLTQNNRLNSIESVTGSYATTGSNVFVGNQIITGSLSVTGSINRFQGDVEITGSNPGSGLARSLKVSGSVAFGRSLFVGTDSGSVGGILAIGQNAFMTASGSFSGTVNAQAQLPSSSLQNIGLFASASYGVGLASLGASFLQIDSGSNQPLKLLRNTQITGSLIVSGSNEQSTPSLKVVGSIHLENRDNIFNSGISFLSASVAESGSVIFYNASNSFGGTSGTTFMYGYKDGAVNQIGRINNKNRFIGENFLSGSKNTIVGDTTLTGSLFVSASAGVNNVITTNYSSGYNYFNGAGNIISSFGGSGAYTNNALIAYNGGFNNISGSSNIIEGLTKINGNTTLTGSLNVTGSITGSSDGTFNGVKIGRGLGNISSNTIVSRNAFGVNTTGQYNTILGDTNLGLSQTGNENTIIGYNNMNAATNANSNIAIGNYVMNNSISPGSNIGIGRFNLQYNTSGSSNVSIGLYSAQYSTGSRNVAVGESALNRALNDNIGIGYNAGEYETGSSKLYIDSVDRANLNSAISGSILYGEMNSVPANQNLRINSKAVILNGLNIEGGGATITGSLTASGSAHTIIGNTTITGSLTASGSAHTIIGNTTITGSLNITSGLTISGSIIQTGSVQGNVVPLTITSNTASLNLDNGNFFTLQLVSGQATHLNPSNIKPGQTVSVFVNTIGSATMTFPSSVKQISGSAYTPTTSTGLDVLTFVSKDTSNLYMVNAKNFI